MATSGASSAGACYACMYSAQLPRPRVRRLYCLPGAFFSSHSALRAPCRNCRSSATCSTVTHGLPSSLYLLIACIQELSRPGVCSITSLLLVHNAAGRAYILGGGLCPNGQGIGCPATFSVEMLDMLQGKWQSFPVPLGRVAQYFQSAILDHELGAS